MIIYHKVNTIEKLREVPVEDGIEMDVRWDSRIQDVIVSHDLVSSSEYLLSFKEWMKEYKQSFLIVNVKDSQLEDKVIEILKDYKIKWYFLDSQIPDIVRLSKQGYGKHFISRVSRYEWFSSELIEATNRDYTWLDTFGESGIDMFKYFKKEKCYIIVSPELHKKPENMEAMKSAVKVLPHYLVCTDFPEFWR